MQHIPSWAYNATNEVIASGLLNSVPDTNKVINSEYLSKEQVAYLVGALRSNSSFAKNLANAGSQFTMLQKSRCYYFKNQTFRQIER